MLIQYDLQYILIKRVSLDTEGRLCEDTQQEDGHVTTVMYLLAKGG